MPNCISRPLNIYSIILNFLISIIALLLFSVGQRVYARWYKNGHYYKGYISRSGSLTYTVQYDDGDVSTFTKSDQCAITLDQHPKKVKLGDRVIGYWPNRSKYYPGYVKAFCGYRRYYVQFDDGDVRCNKLSEIRTINN